VPGGARARAPAAARLGGVPRLVETAGGLLDHDSVHVAARVPAALDAGVRAQRVADLVALVGIVEGDAHLGMAGGYDGDGDAVVRAVAVRRAEVRGQGAARGHLPEPRRAG